MHRCIFWVALWIEVKDGLLNTNISHVGYLSVSVSLGDLTAHVVHFGKAS